MPVAQEKTLLLITDDDQIAREVPAFLKDEVKQVAVAVSGADAVRKITNQLYDGILVRTKRPSLNDPSHAFQYTQTHKKLKNIPWIVLGKDIEDEEIVITQPHVKFLADPRDREALLGLVKTFFLSGAAGTDKAPVDVNFVNPIVSAVVQVLGTMAQLELTRGTPFLKKATDSSAAIGDISGMIAMNSNRFLGSMAICFEKSLALQVYAKMLGETPSDLNDDVKDAVSELTNVIFGNAKRDLNVAGHTIAPAIPTVVTGPKHEIRHAARGEVICIPFSCPHGKLMVECMISPKNA